MPVLLYPPTVINPAHHQYPAASPINAWCNHHRTNGETIYVPPKKPDGIFLWFPQVLALTRNYSVYVPDLLFFGGSTTDRTERSTAFQAEFLAKGMEILKVKKVTLVGLSYGGIVGFEMAKLYLELVKSLVVTGSVIELTESISHDSLQQLGASSWPDLLLPETINGFKGMFNAGAHKLQWLPNFVYHGIFETMFTNRKERSELLAAMVIPDKDAITNTNYSQAQDTYIMGEEDKIFSLEVAKDMKMRLGERTTLKSMNNGGHPLSLEKPIAYNQSLKRFLASITTNI